MGTSSSPWLLWISIGLLTVAAIFAWVLVKNSAPKDPQEYRHVRPGEYYLYVPKAYSAEQEWPLFVGIHGAGGSGLDCWNLWQSYADKEGYILLCPSIPGDSSGFYQDVGENTVWGAIGEVKRDYRVRARMFFAGFSAGAFFIQGFTYHYPQYVSGLSILSSGVYLNPNVFAELVPILVVIGDGDNEDAVQTSQVFVSDLRQFGFDIQYELMPGVGHAVTKDGVKLTLDLFRKTIDK
jgi:predicted esterase